MFEREKSFEFYAFLSLIPLSDVVMLHVPNYRPVPVESSYLVVFLVEDWGASRCDLELNALSFSVGPRIPVAVQEFPGCCVDGALLEVDLKMRMPLDAVVPEARGGPCSPDAAEGDAIGRVLDRSYSWHHFLESKVLRFASGGLILNHSMIPEVPKSRYSDDLLTTFLDAAEGCLPDCAG